MPRILVIDDDNVLRLTVKTMLESDGHVVTLAVDGEDGIQKFGESAFDLVICDVFMPNVDGMETIRRRAGGDGPAGIRFSRPSARLSGATKTIAKPFGRDQLLSLLWRLLGSSATRSTG